MIFRKNNWLAAVSITLIASGCVHQPEGTGLVSDKSAERREALDKLKNPNIPTIEGSILEQAISAEKNGEYRKASAMYLNLIDKDPKNLTYRLGNAEALRKAGDSNASLMFYDEVLDKEPTNIDAMEGKALALLARGDFDKSAKLFNSVIEADAARPRAINGIGIILAVYGKLDESLQYLKSALDLDERNVPVLNNVGLVLAMKDDLSAAESALQEAASLSKEGSSEKKKIELNLALVYGLSKKMSQAEGLLKRHLIDAEVYNNLGYFAQLADDPKLARAYLNQALVSSPVHYKKAWENMKSVGGNM